MRTKSEVSILIVDEFLAQCRTSDTSGAYHAMIARAREMVLSPGHIELREDGTAKVRSMTHADLSYLVNGQCDCPSALYDPKHICKHRIAAKAYRHLVGRLEAIEVAGHVHTHLYICGHSAGRVPCYDVACPDREEAMWCPVCAGGEAETPVEAPEECEECAACGREYVGKGPCTSADCALQVPAMQPAQDAPHPSQQAPALQGVPAAVLPEAPCSVNVFLCIQGRRAQVTLRGTDEAAVLARLERVLAQYPAPASEGN